jgi:outer membrane protein
MVMDRLLSRLLNGLRQSAVHTFTIGTVVLGCASPGFSQVSTSLLDAEVEESTTQVEMTQPWWEPLVGQGISRTSEPIQITLDQLLISALENSQQIKVFSDIPLIRETAIVESQGRFDWHAFAENSFESANHPVGSNLDTGVPGVDRLIQDQWKSSVGLRKQTTTGGTLELRQGVGTLNNNSRFLVPQQQANSRLSLNYTQPLLNGAGRPYNTSLILLSEIDANIAQDEFARQLQSHLLEVTRAYWTLHLERSLLIQKQNLYRQGLKVQQSLKAREEIDVVRSQTVLVEAAVAERKSDLIRAAAAVRNSEARIRALINDPSFAATGIEFVPQDVPTQDYIPFNLADVQTTAIAQRPEIQQNIKQVHAAGIRLNMSKNELLPQLNAVFGVYAEGLQGDYQVSDSWIDQFSTGRPSANAGFMFDIPIGNRQARGRYSRREIELRQMQSQLATTMATLSLEAEVAVREVETSYAEMQLKYQSMKSAVERVAALKNRWEKLPGEDQSGPLFLNTLLEAQSKATKAESDFASSKLTYSLALMNLKKAMGTLLKQEMISQERTYDGVSPQILVTKPRQTAAVIEREPTAAEPTEE